MALSRTASVAPKSPTAAGASVTPATSSATPMPSASHTPCTAWCAAARSSRAPRSRDTAAVVP